MPYLGSGSFGLASDWVSQPLQVGSKLVWRHYPRLESRDLKIALMVLATLVVSPSGLLVREKQIFMPPPFMWTAF